MRRQSVIMLLGLMTYLSLPAFAIAGSRESNHAIQPYKYIGKELDRAHGLDWYDHGARHYDPVTGRWNAVDALAEKYYVWSHDERASDADGFFSKEMGGLPVLVIGKDNLYRAIYIDRKNGKYVISQRMDTIMAMPFGISKIRFPDFGTASPRKSSIDPF